MFSQKFQKLGILVTLGEEMGSDLACLLSLEVPFFFCVIAEFDRPTIDLCS